MDISARFYTSSLIYCRDRGSRIELQPVTRGEHNKPWSSATPSGRLHLYSLDVHERDWFAQQISDRPGEGYGCEFDATITNLEGNLNVFTRPLRINGFTQTNEPHSEGRVHFVSPGAWTEMDLLITNPRAFVPLWEHFLADNAPLWLGLR